MRVTRSSAIRAALVIVVACLSAASAVYAQASSSSSHTPGEARFLGAREAVQTGDLGTLERLAREIDGHPLDSYVRYWLFSSKLARSEPPPPEDLLAFLEREEGAPLAERLRADWLRRLARDGDWERFLALYPGLQEPDGELRCLAWNARLTRGDARAVDEIAVQWSTLSNIHAACAPALRAALNRRKISTDDVWRLFRRQVDSRAPANARITLAWLDESSVKALDHLVRKPRQYLDRLPASFATSRTGRELAMAAIARLAREDVNAAHLRLQRIAKRLDASERAHVWATLALRAAQAQKPEAAAWFRSADNAPMSEEQRAWRVRVALRTGNWRSVLAAIDRLPEQEHALPEWTYWRGRALKALNRMDEAQAEFTHIASVPNFYGILASEELGQRFDPLAVPPSTVPEPNVDRHPGFQRALVLFRLGMRIEAVREWNWALRGRDEAFRLAAARLALHNHLYDRAITSAELANPAGAWDLRFLTPFRELIEPHAQSKNLDVSWVYGVMRQESRFIVPARSHSGAQGLMQIMPTTGKWVARRLGLRYHPGLLTNPETNVELGTEYMRIVLDELGDDPVQASAGYNAGPGRARRWRDGSRALEGAIYAETIPIDETRDYVKKVMTNTVIYATLLEGQPQSLKARLGTIPPRAAE
ncbi:MAG: lytic transglycosylase domain-containing protein [Azoarcus sp.]|jgi:soluble lytic murein transglycosylase|nr:lytic transglycosylase domain-containing protein [Azoarcus sp.]